MQRHLAFYKVANDNAPLTSRQEKEIEDIAWPREDTTFLFECCKILTIFQLEKRIVVSPSDHVMFCLLYKHQ